MWSVSGYMSLGKKGLDAEIEFLKLKNNLQCIFLDEMLFYSLI